MGELSDVPTVTVVVPTRNRASLLPRAIESVLRQTRGDLEVVVFDDASTDDTAEYLHAASARDARVRTLRSDRAIGAAAARNRAIAAARGAWIAPLDDDDEWLPGKLDRQLAVVEARPDADVVACAFERVTPGGERSVLGGPTGGDPATEIFRACFLSHATALFRADILRTAGGYDESLPRLQDWDLLLRVLPGARLVHLAEALLRVYETEDSISRRPEALVTAAEIIRAKVERAHGARSEPLADWLAGAGHLQMIQGAPAAGRRYLLRSLRLRPTRLRRAVLALAAALGPGAYSLVARGHLAWSSRRSREAAVPPS